MIKEVKGNLLEADAEALVNAVNSVGVMGKGLALQFRRKFSEDYFLDYKRACQTGRLRPGKVHVYILEAETGPRIIVNFPTKDHWREKSRLEHIESGLQNLIETIKKHRIETIAMPALGCGLGGLEWKDARPLIEAAFTKLPDVEVFLYAPS
jgi:O-acetyl-ADP-ribose deacetylase (regulator of RNase III)